MNEALTTIIALAVALWCGVGALTVTVTDEATTAKALHITDFFPPKP